jgi:hypothetical protein
MAMATDSQPIGTQDSASSDAIANILNTILAQLSTINKRMELHVCMEKHWRDTINFWAVRLEQALQRRFWPNRRIKMYMLM